MSQLLTQGLLSAKLLIKGLFGRTSTAIAFPLSAVLTEQIVTGTLTENKITGTLTEQIITGVLS